VGREELPLTWNASLLAIIPGIFATVGLIRTDFSAWMLVGLIGLVTFLIFAYWSNNKQLPGWSLLAIGMLASTGIVIASGVVGGLSAVIAGKSANIFVLLILLVILTILLSIYKRSQRISPLVWMLFATIVLCQLTVRIKYFVLFGMSLSVVSQWLSISLYAALMGLMLPVVLGTLLSKRYGYQTMLFVIGMIFVSFQILIDVNYKVSAQIGGTQEFIIYKASIPFLITVLTPLWYLRAQTLYSRIVECYY